MTVAEVKIIHTAGLGQPRDPRPLDGRVAVVTGSTSGIGLAVASALAEIGAMLVINGFGDAAEIEKLCHGLGARHDVPVRYDGADMTKPDAIVDMIERTVRAFGPVDILVNNAGIQHVAPIDEFPPETWDRVKARRWGRIVNIASAHGLVGSPFKSAYVAAKHGVVGLTKVTALETAEIGITCNAVCPGYVLTPLVEKQIAAQAAVRGIPEEEVVRTVLLAEQPNKRFATADEIAGIVTFLCGPAAASITGTTIAADGGWTAH
jgi:3-hydroxybutyrate dehydrogenase